MTMKSGHRDIRIEDYSYELPESRIAPYPLEERDMAKLLVWDGRNISDRHFTDLPQLLDSDTLLVFNNTRVIRARLLFTRESGAAIEIFCLEPSSPGDFAMNLSSAGPVRWKCLVGNLKKWKGDRLTSRCVLRGRETELSTELQSPPGATVTVKFAWDNEEVTFGEILESLGHMPIPPYLGRDDEESDRENYQTVYARIDGSVAAPTAGLHFTASLFDRLAQAGISREEVTLHVSAGTFRPVKTETIGDHTMHSEHFFVTADTLRRLRGRKITAVGTTTVRTLESLYWLGKGLIEGSIEDNGIPSVPQWAPYSDSRTPDPEIVTDFLLEYMKKRGRDYLEALTELMIIPGYRFRYVNSMITNFHQPRSTLLLLVAAFTGKEWKTIYNHSLESGYRFLSYGDGMLLKGE